MELSERLKALCVDFEAAIDRELIASRIEKTDEFKSLALAMVENRTAIIAALRLRTDAGDEEVHWLPEDDADTDTECRLIKMINENHDIAITQGQQLRSAREEIERLKEREVECCTCGHEMVEVDGQFGCEHCDHEYDDTCECWRCRHSREHESMKSQIATLTAERDEARKEVEALKTTDKSNAAMSDRCNRVLRVLRDTGNPDAESAFWIIAGDARDGREAIARLTSELAVLKSCPEMGEVDDILTPWAGQPFKSIVDGFEEMRAIASHATEKQRADEAERLLKWLLDFGSSEFDASKTIREVLVRSGFPEANEILAICGE